MFKLFLTLCAHKRDIARNGLGMVMSIAEILARLQRDQRGLAAVEYALLCGLIVLVMITALNGMANVIEQTWNNISYQTQTSVQQATGS